MGKKNKTREREREERRWNRMKNRIESWAHALKKPSLFRSIITARGYSVHFRCRCLGALMAMHLMHIKNEARSKHTD